MIYLLHLARYDVRPEESYILMALSRYSQSHYRG